LLSHPNISLPIFRPLLGIFMAWSINLDNKSPFVADKVDDETSNRCLPAEFGALAPAVSNGAPDDCLGMHEVSALLAGEAKHDGAGNVQRHGMMLARCARFCKVQSRRAARDHPSSVMLRMTPSPARGKDRALSLSPESVSSARLFYYPRARPPSSLTMRKPPSASTSSGVEKNVRNASVGVQTIGSAS
jgi:hypothetical protein